MRSAVCAPSRRLRKNIAARPERTPSVAALSSASIPKTDRLIPAIKLPDCFYQAVYVVPAGFAVNFQSVITSSLSHDQHDACDMPTLHPRLAERHDYYYFHLN